MAQLSFADIAPEPLSSTIRRPIHYLGSKLRVASEIAHWADKLDPSGGRACDLFSGSGAVSLALARRRPVVAVDIQEYSRVLCSAVLRSARPLESTLADLRRDTAADPLHESLTWAMKPMVDVEDLAVVEAAEGRADLLCHLLEHGSIIGAQLAGTARLPTVLRGYVSTCLKRLGEIGHTSSRDSLIVRYFGGPYFGYQQAVDLDVLRCRIAEVAERCRDTALAALLSTASEIVNTVGKQFAQPIRPRDKAGRPKRRLWVRIHRDRIRNAVAIYHEWLQRYVGLPDAKGPNMAIRADYRDFLATLDGEISVLYADPPYTRDHYSRYYHVLETICLRDNPVVSMSNLDSGRRLSRGVYRSDRHQSPFCIVKEAPRAFSELFALASSRGIPMLLSYSPYDPSTKGRPRVMSVDDIRRIASTYYRRVSVEAAGPIAHSKLNRAELNVTRPREAELFVICET
jgi:adenine-specific DNA methylase